MFRLQRLQLSAILMLLVVVSPARAHDFWIEPTSFDPAPGAVIGLRLRVGQDFMGDAVARDEARIERFVAVGAQGERPIVGRDGGDPAGFLRIDATTPLLVGYRSRPEFVQLDAAKFEEYLALEGLDRISAMRASRGERDRPGREIFSRCAKALLVPRTAMIGAHPIDRAIGLRLELISEQNPLRIGQSLSFRLLYEGRPLEGALVVAMNRGAPAAKLRVRTDRQGRVSIQVAQPGVWLIKAVHMISAPPSSNADWESLWASLIFQLPDSTTPGDAQRSSGGRR
jgi:uncharacterized GH25 family protein